jgi:hypothetical protein
MTSIIGENPEAIACKYIVSEVYNKKKEEYYLYVTIFTTNPLNDPTKSLIKLNVGTVDPVVDSIKAELPAGTTTSKNCNLVSVTKDYIGNSITPNSSNENIFTRLKQIIPSNTNVAES